MDDFNGDDDIAGWPERELRKDKHRRKRDHRDRDRRAPQRVRPAPRPPARASARRREEFQEDSEGELVDLFEEGLDEMQGVRPRRRAYEEGPWSRAVRMSRNLRIQATKGYRAAVMELRPGLYLVAEIPEEVGRSEFGFIPLLAPLMLRSAARVIHPDPERRGLFHRREPLALPGPTVPMLPGPVHPGMPVPKVGWADASEIAEIGCERCAGRCK